jgi:hypothetical protein
MAVVACDLDKTLAKHRDGQKSIGAPIPKMVKRIKAHLAAGDKVVILTARLSRRDVNKEERAKIHRDIALWTKRHIGRSLQSTAEKRPEFEILYDDRAIPIVPGKGTIPATIKDLPHRHTLLKF